MISIYVMVRSEPRAGGMCTGAIGCGRCFRCRRESTATWPCGIGGYEGVVETPNCMYTFLEEDVSAVSGSHGLYEGSSSA